MLSNKVFDVLKWVCMVFLGAFGALYQGLSGIWGLPYGAEIADTCSKIATFMGVCLGISTIQYKHNQNKLMQDTNSALQEELAINLDNTFENFHEDEFKD